MFSTNYYKTDSQYGVPPLYDPPCPHILMVIETPPHICTVHVAKFWVAELVSLAVYGGQINGGVVVDCGVAATRVCECPPKKRQLIYFDKQILVS